MTSNFWNNLPKPFSVLAPMEDVTDTAFRRIVKSCYPPDVFFTEFTSTDGLFSVGSARVKHRLDFTPDEQPLVAQIWGNKPENYFKAAKLIKDLGFVGIDINMGCPVEKVVKKGSCAGLINNPNLAKELYLAASEGADLPVSIKTRCGFDEFITEDWCSFLLELKPAAITLHARIAKHMSTKPARWEEVKKLVELRNQSNSSTVIIGNGDVSSYQDIQLKHQTTGADGIMIGRGIFDNLQIFNPQQIEFKSYTAEQKLSLLKEHLLLFSQRFGSGRRYSMMKKFFGIYVSNFDSAAELRKELMTTDDCSEAIKIINQFLLGINNSSASLTLR